MKKKTILISVASFSAVGLAFALVNCGGDDTVTPPQKDAAVQDTAVTDSNPGTDSGGNPMPPALGAQIDRIGRPAINTAANNVFNTDSTSQGMAKDKYNADNNLGGWVASYTGEAAKNIAIYDGLDTYPDAASGCGNNFLCGAANDGGVTQPGAYNQLAGALADDRLYTKTDATTCTTYLAVEANATKVIPNMDCGGRTLKYDVIDVTYSVVSIGAVSGVGDGIGPDTTKTGGTTFPYLAAAQ